MRSLSLHLPRDLLVAQLKEVTLYLFILSLLFNRKKDDQSSHIPAENGHRDPLQASPGSLSACVPCAWLHDWNRVAWKGPHIYISDDSSLVSINTDYPGQFVLTPQGILVSQPDHISHCNVLLSCVPLAPYEQVRTSQLAPLLPEFADLCLCGLESLVWVTFKSPGSPFELARPSMRELGLQSSRL